jgi:hypothetical protein
LSEQAVGPEGEIPAISHSVKPDEPVAKTDLP